MVNNITIINARVWERELTWLEKVIVTRLNLYFEQECDHRSIWDVPLPHHPEKESTYVTFISTNDLQAPERLVMALAVASHLMPQVLDHFFFRNTQYDRGFTEFGGVKGTGHGGFLPTGETALFLLAGKDLKQRFTYQAIFQNNHFFAANHILTLASVVNSEPPLSGALKLSEEFVEQMTTGYPARPNFSMEFPAKLITTSLAWTDLVLPSRTLEQLDEIKTWVTHSHTLMNDWGMDKKLKPGFKSLFYGPPGTGKTLTASLLGKQCNMDVYRIDLSMMISKYIGETEKNLSRIFDMAEHKNWILFFDEAEALFGKRTAVSDAHDRFANQEVSYLLQRIEDFNGVVILATNLKSNIDDAFTRRFQSVIYFPLPAPDQRLQLWNNAFPSVVARDENINLRQIAFKYELTGGTIMNIMRYSSLRTLQRNECVIKLQDIEQGIRTEYLKEGKVIA